MLPSDGCKGLDDQLARGLVLCNQGVGGSNPSAGTKMSPYINILQMLG
jgi:hypothetical protein